MDAGAFVDSPFGRPTQEPGNRWAFTYYLPRPVPRHLDLSAPLIALLSEADAALGHLQGLSALLPDPALLIGPYVRREAVASTRIEGTQASLSDVLRDEVGTGPGSEDVREVHRYLEATQLAYDLARTLPITQRLILQVHEVLLRGLQGESGRPGELRTSPVWVGHRDATPETATYVPPLPQHLPELMSDWELFVNEDGRHLPALLQAALMHYQLETIHPFLDGNGRIGRLLINVLLMERGRLSHPVLYLSHYFETHRDDYYGGLQGVRERGDIDTWLTVFLNAVKAQADDAVRRSSELIRVREEYLAVAHATRSALPALMEGLMRNPYVTARSAETATGLSNQGARNLIRRAEDLGWLEHLGARGRGGQESWVASRILDAMASPMTYR